MVGWVFNLCFEFQSPASVPKAPVETPGSSKPGRCFLTFYSSSLLSPLHYITSPLSSSVFLTPALFLGFLASLSPRFSGSQWVLDTSTRACTNLQGTSYFLSPWLLVASLSEAQTDWLSKIKRPEESALKRQDCVFARMFAFTIVTPGL